MIAEVIAVGTELLLGQTTNTNATVIGSALADLGYDAHFQQVVGDNLDRMQTAINLAVDRAQVIIITGGIGPTQDDITREALAAATGRELQFNPQYFEVLERRFADLGIEMPPSNRQQAYHPQGAELLPNRRGTAPGLSLATERGHFFVVPGVPAEMEEMLERELRPRLQAIRDTNGVLVSRMLRTWGKPEAWVADRIDDLFQLSTNPSLAFLAGSGEIKIRLSAKAENTAAATQLIEPLETEIRERLGGLVFGADDQTIDVVLSELLQQRGWTLGTIESATGGMIGARITSVPGSSAYYRGSLVVYDPLLKESLLGIPAETIAGGVVTEEVAGEMASRGRERLGVDVAVSVSGSAGPDRLEQAVGTMVIGVATPDECRTRLLTFPGDRERVRFFATIASLHLLRLGLTGQWWRPGR